MPNIFSITAPIYIIIACGFLSVRFGLFDKRETRVLGLFVTNFCLPALLFRAMSSHPVGEVLNGWYLLAYGLGSLSVLLGAVYVFHRRRGVPMARAALQGLGMSSSNSAYIGYPIASQLLGPPAAVGLALVMVIENVLVVPLALAMADSGEKGPPSLATLAQSFKALARNPLILAIAAGFSVALLDIELPEVLTRTVQIVAAAASPIALFVIGAALVGLRLEGMLRDVAVIAIGKLVLHPLAVTIFVLVLPIDPALRSAALVFAAVPMLSIYPVIAQKHHLESLCAAALLIATVASFVTISLWLWAVRDGLGWAI